MIPGPGGQIQAIETSVAKRKTKQQGGMVNSQGMRYRVSQTIFRCPRLYGNIAKSGMN